MKLLQITLVVTYLFMAPLYFTSWLKLFNNDTTITSNERLVSMVILVMSTILWPLIVPIAYLELLNKKNNEIDQSMDVNS